MKLIVEKKDLVINAIGKLVYKVRAGDIRMLENVSFFEVIIYVDEREDKFKILKCDSAKEFEGQVVNGTINAMNFI